MRHRGRGRYCGKAQGAIEPQNESGREKKDSQTVSSDFLTTNCARFFLMINIIPSHRNECIVIELICATLPLLLLAEIYNAFSCIL
jgi:hypothetical protein